MTHQQENFKLEKRKSRNKSIGGARVTVLLFR